MVQCNINVLYYYFNLFDTTKASHIAMYLTTASPYIHIYYAKTVNIKYYLSTATAITGLTNDVAMQEIGLGFYKNKITLNCSRLIRPTKL